MKSVPHCLYYLSHEMMDWVLFRFLNYLLVLLVVHLFVPDFGLYNKKRGRGRKVFGEMEIGLEKTYQ